LISAGSERSGRGLRDRGESVQQATFSLWINARLFDAQNGVHVSIATTATFQTQDDVGLLFGKEGRWRVERGAEARRAKSLTPGFNSNRLLGKASDGNGQAWCKGKRGSRSEIHSNRAPFSDSKPFDLPGKHISDASLGLDHLRRARVVLQFAAKAENLHIYAAIEDVFVDSSRL
jgi:hypothetical protein